VRAAFIDHVTILIRDYARARRYGSSHIARLTEGIIPQRGLQLRAVGNCYNTAKTRSRYEMKFGKKL
jgi:hypothetical protein